MSAWPRDAQPRTIVVSGNGSDELAWEVPDGVVLAVESVYAEIDTAAAGSGARLTARDPSGVVIARKRQGESIDPLASGSATWALRLADERAAVRRIESPLGTVAVVNPDGPTVELEVALPVSALPRIHVFNNGPLMVGSGVPFTVTMTTVINLRGVWTGAVNYPSRLTVPEDGLYIVNATIRWFSEADVAFRSILLNVGGSFEGGAQGPKQNGATLAQSATCVRFLLAGTTISLTGISSAVGLVRIDGAHLVVARIQ